MAKIRAIEPVVIVGGGPVGLGCALFLAQHKIQSIVYEKQPYPIDKVCGEGVMPHGIALLKELGVFDNIPTSEKHPFLGIQYYFAGAPSIGADFSNGVGFGIRRTALSRALYQAAKSEPSIDIFQQSIQSLNEFAGQFVIAADGMRSNIRRMANIPLSQSPRRRYGTRLHFSMQPWSNYVEIYWGEGFEAYVTPAGNNQVGVAFLWHKHRMPTGIKPTPAYFLDKLPRLSKRLTGCPSLSQPLSTGPFYQTVPKPYNGQICLIGDAAGYLDPLTGEGISLGLMQAKVLAKALAENKLDPKKFYGQMNRRFFWHRNFTKTLVILSTQAKLLHFSIGIPWLGRRAFSWIINK